MSGRETFVKKSKKCVCNLTLRDMGFLKKNYISLDDANAVSSDSYKNIVLFSPSSQSNLGIKLSKKIQKHIDDLVLDIKHDLDIKNTYFFSSYNSKDITKKNLNGQIQADSNTFICLYCSNSFTESLFASIRNALAHGNIIKKDQYYYLFSVSSKGLKNIDEFDRDLSFLLKLRRLDKLDSYITAFNRYN